MQGEPMGQPDVSLIICTYNRAPLLRGAVQDLVRQETEGRFSFEILVIDDGSTDETSQVVHEVMGEAHVPVRYAHTEGRGIAEARNRGISEARGKWLAFFDDDQLAEPDWLKQLLLVAFEAGAVCVAGIRELKLPEGSAPHLGPVARSLLGEQVYRGKPAIIKGRNNPSSGTFLISRSLLDSIGPFSARLSTRGLDVGGEDFDYMIRTRRSGYPVWSAPSAVTYHLIPSYRLTYPYLKWVSLRWGSQLAQIDYRYKGRIATLGLCTARAVQAVSINFPLLVVALLKNDRSEQLDRKLLLWRALAYVRQYACMVLPRLFDPDLFSSALEFRQERGAFGPKL
jgi:glycosyltransferase involved in cell wall biosynthesis